MTDEPPKQRHGIGWYATMNNGRASMLRCAFAVCLFLCWTTGIYHLIDSLQIQIPETTSVCVTLEGKAVFVFHPREVPWGNFKVVEDSVSRVKTAQYHWGTSDEDRVDLNVKIEKSTLWVNGQSYGPIHTGEVVKINPMHGLSVLVGDISRMPVDEASDTPNPK